MAHNGHGSLDVCISGRAFLSRPAPVVVAQLSRIRDQQDLRRGLGDHGRDQAGGAGGQAGALRALRGAHPGQPREPRRSGQNGLVVEGAAFARFGLFGQINGYGREKKVGLRPSLGKPNPYYVHTTVTVRWGSTISFAAAAANGPELVYWGPIDSCLAT